MTERRDSRRAANYRSHRSDNLLFDLKRTAQGMVTSLVLFSFHPPLRNVSQAELR
tara:strand:- start:3669 stop:3833 length:165 start_codon:yes stop_codon:yes gene_type:complete